MSDDLPDLSEFDKYLDDEDLEKLKRQKETAAGGSGAGAGGSGSGGGKKKAGRRPRRLVWLLAGLVFGVSGTLFLPDLLRPYLPSALRLGETEVPGLVVEKRREGDRLLLTVDTDRGASLATFTTRVSEIDLLVSEGDSVTLGLGEYAPLVEDPSLLGVRKGRGTEAAAPDTGVTRAEAATDAAEPATPAAEDTAAPATDTAAPSDPDTAGD